MRVAYEYVRLAPRSELTSTLLECSLEDELTANSTGTVNEGQSLPEVEDTSGATLVEKDPPPPPPQTQPNSNMFLAQGICVEFTIRNDREERDIENYADKTRIRDRLKDLQRNIDKELADIHNFIGSKQVKASHLASAQTLIAQEALRSEHDSNWADAYTEVTGKGVPRNANVITSHVVYKLKSEEGGSRDMKARIVPHGNHDDDKESQRSDSSNAPLFVVRILLSLVNFLGFRLGTADIKRFLPTKRTYYLRHICATSTGLV